MGAADNTHGVTNRTAFSVADCHRRSLWIGPRIHQNLITRLQIIPLQHRAQRWQRRAGRQPGIALFPDGCGVHIIRGRTIIHIISNATVVNREVLLRRRLPSRLLLALQTPARGRQCWVIRGRQHKLTIRCNRATNHHPTGPAIRGKSDVYVMPDVSCPATRHPLERVITPHHTAVIQR